MQPIEAPAAREPGSLPGLGRLVSLDVFRGATIAGMILVNNSGNFSQTYAPLLHADWHGWTPTDMVFPFFLWMVGVSMTFSMARRVAEGADRGKLLAHALRRGLIIVGLGLALNLLPHFDFANLRFPGVLQRIGVCYMAATLIFLFTRWRGQVIALGGVLALYWGLMTLYPVPGHGAGVLSKEGNFARYFDGLLLEGHMWASSKTWDPEGIVSTLPAIGTTLFGVLAGHLLRTGLTLAEKCAWLMAGGNGLLFAGLMLSTWMPINKPLWTVPYAIFMAGLASAMFGLCYWLIDGQGWRRGTRWLAIYGMNAITIYVLSGLIAKTMGLIRLGELTAKGWVMQNICLALASGPNASLLYALANVAVCYAAAWWMYSRGWFVRV
ncbi:MAG: DUF5009 domain-containing protein [Acidobacteria bacterium]|nr:DUF5009 domain-containing protein [Acidobacteriota bacterium]